MTIWLLLQLLGSSCMGLHAFSNLGFRLTKISVGERLVALILAQFWLFSCLVVALSLSAVSRCFLTIYIHGLISNITWGYILGSSWDIPLQS